MRFCLFFPIISGSRRGMASTMTKFRTLVGSKAYSAQDCIFCTRTSSLGLRVATKVMSDSEVPPVPARVSLALKEFGASTWLLRNPASIDLVRGKVQMLPESPRLG